MALRVSKDSIDLRKKLSELERPIGLKGNELMRSDTVQDARDLVSAGRKNMIINGQMYINQRNSGSYTIPHATGGSYGGPDRWAINEATGGSVSVNMDGDPSSANATGSEVKQFTKAMQIACSGVDNALDTQENLHFFQNIEGYNTIGLKWGTVNASDVTLSFWVRTNVPGIYCVGLENNSTNRCCIKEYTVESGFDWQKIVLTFPGCKDGTWVKDNGCGIRVRFCLGTGNAYNDGIEGEWVNSDELSTANQTNFMTSTSNRFFITGVQLEKGRNATDFEHRPYQEELALCQRYYGKIKMSQQEWLYNESNTSSHKWHWTNIPFSMRINPSVDVSGLSIGGGVSGLQGTISSIAAQTPGDTPGRVSTRITMSQNTGTARYVYHFDGWQNEYMALTAEL